MRSRAQRTSELRSLAARREALKCRPCGPRKNVKLRIMKTTALTSFVTSWICVSTSAAAASYVITEIQTHESYAAGLSGITERGAVVGTLSDEDDDSIAFLWKNGSLQ